MHSVSVCALAVLVLCTAAAMGNAPTAQHRGTPADTYRAGIAQRKFSGSGDDAAAATATNLAHMEEHVRVAASEGVQVVVFPEFAMFPRRLLSMRGHASDLFPWAHTFPAVGTTAPKCSDGDEGDAMPVWARMGCMARAHGVVVVANVNERVGDDVFNTEVAFDEGGVLVGKYHKTHPWYTNMFATPVDQPLSTFKTSFGVEMGMIVCNDIRFGTPKKALLDAGVRHFPYSFAMPTLLKEMLVRSFSYLDGTVVLGANLGDGAGSVYVSGRAASTRTAPVKAGESLLIADVPKTV